MAVILLVSSVGVAGGLWLAPEYQPYAGPPPHAAFELTGYTFVPSVPFTGSLNIRNGQIITPPAPEGYECTYDHRLSILNYTPAFGIGWKPTGGAILLITCKIALREPDPRFEDIHLVRGKQEVAPLDGVLLPGFAKCWAADLRRVLVDWHKQGKGDLPELGLVFRVPSEDSLNPNRIALRVEWRSAEGQKLGGNYSLKHVTRFRAESPGLEAGRRVGGQ